MPDIYPFSTQQYGPAHHGIDLQRAAFRTKDIPYLDVLSESINIPIRLMLGWFMVTSVFLPPLILVLTYWNGRRIFNGHQAFFRITLY